MSGDVRGPGFFFADDPLHELERNVQQNARRLGGIVKEYLKKYPDDVPPKEVIMAQKEFRECVQGIERARLDREKMALATRIAMHRLPSIDEESIEEEVKRLVNDYLHRIDGKTLYALASARLEEERKRSEDSSFIGLSASGTIDVG